MGRVKEWRHGTRQPLHNMHPSLPNVQVDDAIQPGLIALNWTSLNIDKYLDRIDKALGKLKLPERSMLNTPCQVMRDTWQLGRHRALMRFN